MELQNLQGTHCQFNRMRTIFVHIRPNLCTFAPALNSWRDRKSLCAGLARVLFAQFKISERRENVWLCPSELAAGAWINHLNDAHTLWGRKRCISLYGLWAVTSWGPDWWNDWEGSTLCCYFGLKLASLPRNFWQVPRERCDVIKKQVK